jgi:RNA polymerase primary sigma factor
LLDGSWRAWLKATPSDQDDPTGNTLSRWYLPPENLPMNRMPCPRISREKDGSFATSAARIGNDRLLSAGEECSLAEAITLGDGEARDRLVRANLRLVFTIARGFLGRGLILDDLIGEGNLGLLRAAVEFDPGFGVRFSTYAEYWIKLAIREALNNTTAAIRLPSHMVVWLSKWRQAERNLDRELGGEPTFDQIAASLGLTALQRGLVVEAQRSRRVSFGLAVEAAGVAKRPEADLERSDEGRSLRARMMQRLDERERLVITLRFGLEGGDPVTLKEVSKRLMISREWARKLELRAVSKLRVESDAAN